MSQGLAWLSISLKYCHTQAWASCRQGGQSRFTVVHVENNAVFFIRERKGAREGERHLLVVPRIHMRSLVDHYMCPDLGLNPKPTELPGPGYNH